MSEELYLWPSSVPSSPPSPACVIVDCRMLIMANVCLLLIDTAQSTDTRIAAAPQCWQCSQQLSLCCKSHELPPCGGASAVCVLLANNEMKLHRAGQPPHVMSVMAAMARYL